MQLKQFYSERFSHFICYLCSFLSFFLCCVHNVIFFLSTLPPLSLRLIFPTYFSYSSHFLSLFFPSYFFPFIFIFFAFFIFLSSSFSYFLSLSLIFIFLSFSYGRFQICWQIQQKMIGWGIL